MSKGLKDHYDKKRIDTDKRIIGILEQLRTDPSIKKITPTLINSMFGISRTTLSERNRHKWVFENINKINIEKEQSRGKETQKKIIQLDKEKQLKIDLDNLRIENSLLFHENLNLKKENNNSKIDAERMKQKYLDLKKQYDELINKNIIKSKITNLRKGD